MKARVAGIAGSVLALTVIGGFAAASTFQSAPVAPVPVVQPAVVATVAPAVAPTTAAPVVVAPVPVESTQAPVVVAPKSKVVTVPKAVQPAPAATVAPGETLRYGNGELVKRSVHGVVIKLPNCHQLFDADGAPIPLPASCP